MVNLSPVLRRIVSLTVVLIGNAAVHIFVHEVSGIFFFFFFLESFSYHHNVKYKAFEKVRRDLPFAGAHPLMSTRFVLIVTLKH